MDGFDFFKALWNKMSMKACLLVCCVLLARVNGYVINQPANGQFAQPETEMNQNVGMKDSILRAWGKLTEPINEKVYSNTLPTNDYEKIDNETPDAVLLMMKHMFGSKDLTNYQSKQLIERLKKYPQFDEMLNDNDNSQNNNPQFTNQFNNNPQLTNQFNNNPYFTNQMNNFPQFNQMNANQHFTNQMFTGTQEGYQQMQQMFPNMGQHYNNMQEDYYNGPGNQFYEEEEEKESRMIKMYRFMKKWGYYLWVVWDLIEGWGLINLENLNIGGLGLGK